MTEEWLAMINNELSEEDGTNLIAETLTELDKSLKDNPTARDAAKRIIADQLATPLRPTSWGNLMTSLGAFLRPGPAYMLSWVSYGDWEERLARVAGPASTQAEQFIREIIGIFGNDIRRAMDVRVQSPDDWRGLSWNISENLPDGDYKISVEIVKISGDVIAFEGPPNSVLSLATYLLQALTSVKNSAAFTLEGASSFRDQVQELDALLPRPQPEEMAEAAEPGTTAKGTGNTVTLDAVATADDNS
jgi:hypothetical protein